MLLERIPLFYGHIIMEFFIVFGDCSCGKKAVPLQKI